MKISQLIQTNEETDVPIRFLPGYAFFCRTLEVPEGLSVGEELASFAELSLESLSPFPLDQLAWGYLVDAELKNIFIYAACRPRLPEAAMEGCEEAQHVFPGFLPLLLDRPESATLAAIEDETSISLLSFEGGGQFPSKVVSSALPEEISDEERVALLERLMARLGKGPEKAPRVCRCVNTTVDGDSLRFTLQTERTAEPDEFWLNGDENLWAADVREPEFIVAERRRRKVSGRVGWALAGVGVAFALLLFMLLLTGLGNWMVSRRQALVTRQDASTYIVQQNSEFLLQLEQFSGAPFRPFTVLAAANQVLQVRQPRRIEFTSASLASNNEVSIQGEADNVDEVNRYSDNLRSSGYFTEVDMSDVRTRRGKVNFSLKLRFNPESLSELVTQPGSETVAANEREAAPESSDESQSTETPDATH